MKKNCVGIDIAKSDFVAAITTSGKDHVKHFNNNPEGFSELLEWTQSLSDQSLHFCMESTGKYGNALALYLHSEKCDVSIINPTRIKFFMKGQLIRNKTDKADAVSIKDYSNHFTPTLWQPLPANIEALRALIQRSEVLTSQVSNEQNRLELAEETIISSIQNHIDYMEKEILRLQEEISKLIASDDDLKNNTELLKSIPGIGDKTAQTLTAFFNNIERFSGAKQLAAHIGLNPSQSQSGTSLNSSRLSKVGSAWLRKALYMPALVAIRHNPILKKFYEKLLKKGKPKKLAICAVMRKMVHMIYGILKTQQPFSADA